MVKEQMATSKKDQPLKTLQPHLDSLEWGRRQMVKGRMAAGKDQPLKTLKPHLDSLEVGQEAEGAGEDGQVLVGQVQPL
jgi:hypothetical protein